jgi:hypothetical protein
MEKKYYYVSTARFVVFQVLSFGMYERFWMYKNWKQISLNKKEDISPFWRSLWSIFFVYSLFKETRENIEAKHLKNSLSSGILSTLYIIITLIIILISRAPAIQFDTMSIYALFLILNLVPGFILLKLNSELNEQFGSKNSVKLNCWCSTN